MIALVSAREALAGGLDADLPLLQAALARLRVESVAIAWDDPRAEWDAFALAVVRSTWDYVPRRDAFVAWARALPCPLRNDAAVLAWNTDKRYLRELEQRGIAIVPTTWLEPGASVTEVHVGPDGVVVKPAVSAGAKDTARFAAGEDELATAHAARIVASGRTAMVQPYVASVDRRGETGMLFFGGAYSHAIHKSALLAPGARGDVSGLFAPERIEARTPSERERAFAERVLAAVPFERAPLYARVDVVEDEDGTPRLLELELTEPSCFLDMDAGAADRFAVAIARARDET